MEVGGTLDVMIVRAECRNGQVCTSRCLSSSYFALRNSMSIIRSAAKNPLVSLQSRTANIVAQHMGNRNMKSSKYGTVTTTVPRSL